MVRTNLFPLRLESRDGLGPEEYVQYVVEIIDARRRKKVDSEGKIIEPLQFELAPIPPKGKKYSEEEKRAGEKKVDLEKGGNALSRRIMKKLLREEKKKDSTFSFVFDGGSMAVSPRRLFSLDDTPAEVAVDSEGKSEPGKYGPADDGGHNAVQAPSAAAKKTYEVQVKRECEEDDEDADRVRNAWYMVRFTEVCTLPISVVERVYTDQANELKEVEQIRQCKDVILKCAQLSAGMIALAKSSQVLYFQGEQQRRIADASRTLRNIVGQNGPEVLMVGLKQNIQFLENGGVYIQADSAVDYVKREFDNNNNIIPILDERRGTLAGVRVPLDRPIQEQWVQSEVKSALEKMTFHIKYERPPSAAFTTRMREKGMNEAEIRRRNVMVFRNKSLKKDTKTDDASIIWRADDPELYKFDTNARPRRRKQGDEDNSEEQLQPEWHSVASYYREKKGMDLRFPHLPIVYTGRDGWFPVEFLSQALQKAKGANSPNHVKNVLGYYDENSGTHSVDNVKNLVETCASLENPGLPRFDQVLGEFGIRRSREPLEVEAKVLPEPILQFENTSANINNGSWDLRDKRFSRPSELMSFAVVSFANSPDRFLDNLFRVASTKHGMAMPQGIDCMEAVRRITVSVPARSPRDCIGGISDAIDRAKNYFLFDKDNVFRGKNIWFRSRCTNPAGGLSDCLIIPPPPDVEGQVALILKCEEEPRTHLIVNKNNGEEAEARIMACFNENPNGPIDPFDCHYDQRQQCHIVAGRSAHFQRFVYQLEDGTVVELDQIQPNPAPIHVVNASSVECPSVVFIYLNDDKKEAYSVSKMATHFMFGVPSQCVVSKKFASQRSPDQYCSNISLKLNTKLGNKSNQARAWNTTFRLEQGQANGSLIPWVHEVPTLVVGLGCSKGIGLDSVTIIGATAALDTGCMQMAQEMKIQVKKSPLISPSVLIQIIKSLLVQFKLYRGEWPKRMLFYREGLSEGFSKEAVEHEIKCIRKACFDILSKDASFECSDEEFSEGKGSIFNTPLITFVVCHTNSSLKIVPKDQSHGVRNNVFSGTCVDQSVVSSEKSFDAPTDFVPKGEVKLFSGVNDSGRDFVLTAQGGLKGTSKPIRYSAYPNENLCYRNAEGATPLTKELLEKVTYHLSFQYGTATKAVRSVPVLYYSKRLAELGMGYVNYLRGKKSDVTSSVLGVPLDTDNNGEEELTYIRNEMEGLGVSDERNCLLPSFSPFQENKWRSPFSTNLSA